MNRIGCRLQNVSMSKGFLVANYSYSWYPLWHFQFDFLGKDSIQYVNTVEVEPLVYKAIGQFQAG